VDQTSVDAFVSYLFLAGDVAFYFENLRSPYDICSVNVRSLGFALSATF
jgi:hypothetical protein